MNACVRSPTRWRGSGSTGRPRHRYSLRESSSGCTNLQVRTPSSRISGLARGVSESQRVTRPLLGILDGLVGGFDKYARDEELRRYLRDVADHATTVVERVDGFRHMLTDILTVNTTLVNQAQNEEM